MHREILGFPVGRPLTGADVLWRVEARRYSVCVDPELEIYSLALKEQQACLSKKTEQPGLS